jgi:hypothetical protein
VRALLLCFLLAWAGLLGGCGDETVYDWQRPHDTYQVGSFSKADNANALKAKLGQNGFECRIETEIKNGQFVLNVLVDVYDRQPDTMARLERVAGVKPLLRERTPAKTSAPAAPASAPAVPASGI